MAVDNVTRNWQVGRTLRCLTSALSLTFFAPPSTAVAANTCQELTTLQNGGRSMVSLPPSLVPARHENPSAHDLALSWKCTALDQGGDSLVTCNSGWSSNANLAFDLTTGLTKELYACVGKEWQQETVRLGEERATTFLYLVGANIEYETSLQMREAPSSLGIAAAVGVPTKKTVELRAEFAAIRAAAAPPAPSQVDPKSDPMCTQLVDIIKHASSSFRDIRGSKSGDSWLSLKSLPGTTECEIDELSDFSSHQCLRGTYSNRGALRADQVQLHNKFSACLGPEWKTALRPRGNGVWAYRMSKNGSDITIDLRGRARKEKLLLNIDIDHEE